MPLSSAVSLSFIVSPLLHVPKSKDFAAVRLLLALRALGAGSDARGRDLAARSALSVHARARSRPHPHLAPSQPPAALLPLSTEALAADHVLGSAFAVSSAVAARISDARERGWNARAVRGRPTRPHQDNGMADGIRDCAGECVCLANFESTAVTSGTST